MSKQRLYCRSQKYFGETLKFAQRNEVKLKKQYERVHFLKLSKYKLKIFARGVTLRKPHIVNKYWT